MCDNASYNALLRKAQLIKIYQYDCQTSFKIKTTRFKKATFIQLSHPFLYVHNLHPEKTVLGYPKKKITTYVCLYPHLIPDTEVEHSCVTGRLVPWTTTFSWERHDWPYTVPIYIGKAVLTVQTTYCIPGKDVQTFLWAGKYPRLLAVSVTHVRYDLVVYDLLVCQIIAAVCQGNCERYVSRPFCNTKGILWMA